MKITSIERFVLETIDNKQMSYDEIKNECGLKDNVCFNTLQALVIKNIVTTNGATYTINKNISSENISKINHPIHKAQESSELVESFLLTSKDAFVLSKVALNEKDQKIFRAMLKNLEDFINDCHKSNKKNISYKDRSFIFWGMTKNQHLINEVAG